MISHEKATNIRVELASGSLREKVDMNLEERKVVGQGLGDLQVR